MIVGSVVHDGHVALARHLTNASDNESIIYTSESLLGGDAPSGLRELCRLASGARTKAPLLHVWASPSREYVASEWELFWTAYETEFALLGQPYFEVAHWKLGKGGRSSGHRHRVYLRVQENGRAITMSHSAARNEKVARIAEVRNGERLTPGVYSRSVVRHLRQDGLHDVANALTHAGLDLLDTSSTINAKERAEHERTLDMPADAVASQLVRLLSSRLSGKQLETALQAVGLRLAQGDKAIGVVTPFGRFYPLVRTYNRAAKAFGLPSLKAADVNARLQEVGLLPMLALSNEIPGRDPKVVGADRRDRLIGGDRKAEEEGTEKDFLAAKVPESTTELPELQNRQDINPQRIDLKTLSSQQRAAIEAWKSRMFASKAPAHMSHAKLAWAVAVSGRAPRPAPANAARYKAKLANLPDELGQLVRWVDVDGDLATVHLNDGSLVQLEPHRGAATAETPDALAILVAHAKERQWSRTRVTGGSKACREALARRLVREGLTPAGDDVVEAAARDERELISCNAGIRRWRSAQRRFLMAKMSPDGPDAGAAVDELYASSHALIKNERSQALLKAEQYSQLAADYRFASGFLGHQEPQPGWSHADGPRPIAKGLSP